MVFSSLEELTVKLLKPRTPSDGRDEPLRTVLISFVNNHHPTLKSLELGFSSHHSLNISCLFDMRHLPHLRKFVFDGFATFDTSAIWQFLKIHSSGLHELQIGFYHAGSPYGYHTHPLDFPCIRFPKLEVISFRGEACFWNLDRTLVVLQQFETSLTALALPSWRLLDSELEMVVDSLARQCKVRKLHISIRHLDLSLFDLLAAKLPSLDCLDLEFHSIPGSEVSAL